jgi:ABC-type polysaccharide/polyol phosphate export permease
LKTSQLSGIIWPLQSAPKIIQILAQLFPFTSATVAMRDLAFKDSTIADLSVQLALFVLVLWIVVPLEISWVLSERKINK